MKPAFENPVPAKPRVSGFDHLVLTVQDMAASIAFYCDVLGMAHESFPAMDGSQRHALKFGRQKINLHQAGNEFRPHATRPTPGAADLCFLSDVPVDDWLRRLAQVAVPVLEGPVSRTGATGPLRSVYLRDPDGNLIELANPV